MRVENQIQAIATNAAASAAQGFLNTLPPEVSQALSPAYLHHLEEDLRTELFALLQSRLLWSYQAVQLELEAQQRQQYQATTPSAILTPGPTDPPSPPDFLQKPSASSQLLAELRSDPQPIPAPEVADLSPRKRIVTPKSSPQQQAADPTPQLPAPPPSSTSFPPASQAQQPAPAEEAPRPSRRRRGKEPQPSREEIIQAYKIPPEWLNPSDPDAKPRRRRRTSAAMA